MTVTRLPDADDMNAPDVGEVRCTWFAGAKRESGAFPLDALILIVDEGK